MGVWGREIVVDLEGVSTRWKAVQINDSMLEQGSIESMYITYVLCMFQSFPVLATRRVTWPEIMWHPGLASSRQRRRWRHLPTVVWRGTWLVDRKQLQRRCVIDAAPLWLRVIMLFRHRATKCLSNYRALTNLPSTDRLVFILVVTVRNLVTTRRSEETRAQRIKGWLVD